MTGIMTLGIWIAVVVLLLLVAARVAGIAIALSRVLSTKNRPLAPPTHGPGVSLIRPVCGLEHAVEATLGSTYRLDYPDYEVIFCVADENDPVVPLVRRLMAENPDRPSRLLIGDDHISINPKLNNLVKGWKAAQHDWVAMTDSNLLLPQDYLQTLLARWGDRTGMICSPPLGGRPVGFWADLECAFLNEHEALWQLVADGLGIAFAQGKTLFLRREVLDSAGGIEILGQESAEDAAATKVIRKAGLHVRLVPGPFIQPLGRRSFAEVWGRQLRWGRLRHDTFPLVHFPEILVGIVPPAIAGAVLVAAGTLPLPTLIFLVLAWYAAEGLLARAAGWFLSWRSPVAWVLRDLLLPVLWISAWTGKRFTWRGTAMDVAEVHGGPR